MWGDPSQTVRRAPVEGRCGAVRLLIAGIMGLHAAMTFGATHPVEQSANLVVSSPWGTPSPPRGTNVYAIDSTVACSISPASFTAPGGATQYVCTGWTGTGLTPGTGTATSVHLTNDATLSWVWITNVWLSASTAAGGWVFGANRWLQLGATSHVEAAVFGHYRFGGWSGDVPTNQVDDNPLAMTLDHARAVQATFAVNTDSNGVLERPFVSLAVPGALSRLQLETNRTLNGLYTMNMSGCCLLPSTGELLVVINAPPTIQVYSTNGVYRRAITLTGFADVESICLVDAAGNRVALVEEGSLAGHSDICIVTVRTNTTTISKASATLVPAPRPVVDNNGWEGVAYDPLSGAFYLAKERVPMGIFRVSPSDGTYRLEELFHAETAFSGLCTDISDLRYDVESGHLWVLSHEGKRVLECDLSGRVLSSLPLTAVQAEGLQPTADRRTLYVVGEPNECFRFSRGPGQTTVDEGGGLDLSAVLSWPWTGGISVAYQGTGGLAQAGLDYTPATGLLTFAAGSTAAAFRVQVALDEKTEPLEAFSIELTDSSNAVLGLDTAQAVTIPANTSVTLTVRSALGNAVPPEGTHRYNAGTAVACAVTGSPIAVGECATQFACVGWAGSGSVPTQGAGVTVPGLILTTNSEVDWLWRTNVYMQFGTVGSGSVDVATGWYRLGTGLTATASADTYHHFDGWRGDVPAGAAPVGHTLAVTADVPRSVEATFGENLAAYDTPEWWLAAHGVTGAFDEAALGDGDGDGAFGWQEYRAGTVPTLGASVLRIAGIGTGTDGTIRVHWTGGSNRLYRAERAGSLLSGEWTPIGSSIPAAVTGVVVDASQPTPTGALYRLMVEWPMP